MKQYELFEISLQGGNPGDSWALAAPEAVFTNGDEKIRTRGFYDGDGCYKVRFLPEKPGLWHWCITGAVEAEGSEYCEESNQHGPVRAEETHFRYADGKLYLPFGTTVYALAHQSQELIQTTMESLRKSPFNKVRFCVFPKSYRYNQNEPIYYPFSRKSDGQWNVYQPNPDFWHNFESCVAQLNTYGIEADIILFHPYDRWGFAAMTREENLVYLDYAMRRLAAYPNVWWSMANEYDLCLNYKSVSDWEEIEATISGNDPWHHLLSNHNCFEPWDFNRPAITHASIQTKRLADVANWVHSGGKPVIIDECCYEGNIPDYWGSISGKEMVSRFWQVLVSGGYCTHGETYLDPNDILWWAKGGTLKGSSPERIRYLKQIAEQLPGPVEPMEDTAAWLVHASEEELRNAAASLPEDEKGLLLGMTLMKPEDRRVHVALEHRWCGHCGTDAYILYLAQRTCAEEHLSLPKDRAYKIDLIDTWNMKRETILDKVSGDVKIPLPGKEFYAVLALAQE